MKARTNYGYEFLIKMTFIWELDEDKGFLGVSFVLNIINEAHSFEMIYCIQVMCRWNGFVVNVMENVFDEIRIVISARI